MHESLVKQNIGKAKGSGLSLSLSARTNYVIVALCPSYVTIEGEKLRDFLRVRRSLKALGPLTSST